ncbi:MAG: glycerol-3-phosphate 1-O-acyltransferase PlsY [Epsilonproteobacteria bacterium]|nr:glycerol-3-phosphate 1-O-acyltransferase PlsY [Campylobacterota bacterium]
MNINLLFYILAYLIGSIPFGYLLAKYIGGVNIKEAGSKNIGATNVLRVLKEKDPALAKKLGIATFILDALKGAILILIGKAIGLSPSVLWMIGVLSVIGHCFSIYLFFEGGKGVATGFGVMLVLLPIPTLIALLVWIVVAKVTKISSLGALSALIALLVSSYILYPQIPGINSHAPIWIITFIIFYKHIPNIIRLFKKEEKRI